VALKLGQQRELTRRLVMDDTPADALEVKIKEYRQRNSDANATILPVIRGLVPG